MMQFYNQILNPAFKLHGVSFTVGSFTKWDPSPTFRASCPLSYAAGSSHLKRGLYGYSNQKEESANPDT